MRFDKIVTLEKSVVAGKIGDAEPEFIARAKTVFLGVFGF